jgi:hypothetical protein
MQGHGNLVAIDFLRERIALMVVGEMREGEYE